jgi:hypothetical protein
MKAIKTLCFFSTIILLQCCSINYVPKPGIKQYPRSSTFDILTSAPKVKFRVIGDLFTTLEGNNCHERLRSIYRTVKKAGGDAIIVDKRGLTGVVTFDSTSMSDMLILASDTSKADTVRCPLLGELHALVLKYGVGSDSSFDNNVENLFAGGSYIFIASLPPVADVYVDGIFVGKTNIQQLNVPVGRSKLKFIKGELSYECEMVFRPGKNSSKMINLH